MTVTYFEADITVEIAFGYGPTDTPVWTDVSDYVRDFETDRGRRDEFGSYSPGAARVVLSNAGRRFDPSHAAGPYFGDLVPMVPVRISATYDSVDYPLFYGFAQGWPQQYVDNIDSTVTINCVDAFRLLEQATLAESAYRYEVDSDGPIAYWPFQVGDAGERLDEVAGVALDPQEGSVWSSEAIDWTPGEGSAVSGGSVIFGATAELETNAELDSDPFAIEFVFECASFFGPSVQDVDVFARASATSWLRCQILDAGVTATFSNAAANLRETAVFGAYRFQVNRSYHVVVSVDSDDVVRVYVDGVLLVEEALMAGTTSIVNLMSVRARSGNRVAHYSIYDAPLSAARVAAHHDAGRFAWGGDYVEFPGDRIGRVLDQIGWPAGVRDIADGGIALGEYLPQSRSVIDYIREIEVTEQGLFFVAADGDVVFRDRAWQFDQTSIADFGDTAPDLSFADVVPDGNTVDVVRNQVKAIYNGSDSNVIVEDAASIAAYGCQSEALSVPTIQTIGPARGLASFLVRVGKDPRTRVSSLVVKPRSDPANLFPAVLAADLGKVVTVSFTPLGVGSTSTFTTSIQGIRHSVGRGVWDVEFYLAPAVSESGPYWKIGDATFGRIGAAYGNLLSY